MRKLLIATILALVSISCADAQDAPSSIGGAIGNVFEAVGLRKTPPTPPDFVRDSRPSPGELDYEPLKPKPESASDPKKNKETLSAAGSQLERAAAEARRRASRINVPN